MSLSTIKLFNSVVVHNYRVNIIDEEHIRLLHRHTIENGFILDNEIYRTLDKDDIEKIITLVKKYIRTSYKNWNNTFYKSWNKLVTLTDKEILVDHLIHYFTTYGLESLGIDSDFVYVPDTEINLPNIEEENLSLLYIKAITKDELFDKLLSLVSSGVALKEETQIDVIQASAYLDDSQLQKIFDNCKNKELKIRFTDTHGFVPKNSEEFLRYLVYKITDSTLLIKSPDMIQNIKTLLAFDLDKKKVPIVNNLLRNYIDKYGIENLSRIFYRYKPIWLAMRVRPIKPIINRIRKLAPKHHDPMVPSYLDSITAELKKGSAIDREILLYELSRVNTFRKIRLLYSLKYLYERYEEKLYLIRNGKSWSKMDPTVHGVDDAELSDTIDIIERSIEKDMRENGKVEGKTFYIPSKIYYALPTTEKQFIGNIPSKSFVDLDYRKDSLIGIHWRNKEHKRIDLDFSGMNISGSKVGWDGAYRDDRLLFSGDMTGAPRPKGASEVFCVKQTREEDLEEEVYLFQVNFYNLSIGDNAVPFDIMIGEDSNTSGKLKENYTINPNKIILQTQSEVEKETKTIGLLYINHKYESKRFYFLETASSITRSVYYREHDRIKMNYMVNALSIAPSLDSILQKAGGKVVYTKTDIDTIDYDLSPETVDKNTLIEIFS